MSRKRNTLNKTNMGRYISTGIIYQYGFAKSSIPGIESQEVKQQVIEQLFPEIYGLLDISGDGIVVID